MSHSQRVLFRRRYRAFQGGHLKVWDYFNHVRSADGFDPKVWFTADSVWDDTNPWTPLHEQVLSSWNISDTDILFLAGMDWVCLDEELRQQAPIPILNLIQHVRHANPSDKRYSFLSHKAIRICVSREVADAIRATGKVNGPVHVVPNGIDLTALPSPLPEPQRDIHLLIAGLKQPDLARSLLLTASQEFRPPFSIRDGGASFREPVVLTNRIPRDEFLRTLTRSRTAVLLPNPTEGFYLPAIEAMALGCVVVCPDCVGNRSFCRDGINCFRPEYMPDAILAAAQQAQTLPAAARQAMIDAAAVTAARHSLEQERVSFLSILRHTHQMWTHAN